LLTHGIRDAEPARTARVELERLLAAEAPALAAALPPTFGDSVERYIELLLAANARLNLTRITEPDAVARLHLLDALSALPLLDEVAPSSALDLGSGGGVPGIVLALARPDVRWTLVDSVAKKCDALREFIAELGIRSTNVVADRAEAIGRDPAHRERYDVVTARACAALPVLVEYALPLGTVGGALLAWKGPMTSSDDELVAGTRAAAVLGGGTPEFSPTGLAALGERGFVVVTKERQTPDAYPRRPGEPGRRPLG
jgi:16S rRNA (guanine527-N7)-methyltransferase